MAAPCIDDLHQAALICASTELPGSTHWIHGPGPIYPQGWEACTKVFKAWQQAESERMNNPDADKNRWCSVTRQHELIEGVANNLK